MLVPNKVISINESGIFKAAKLLEKIENEILVTDLYTKFKRDFIDIPDYINALDILFILQKIDLDIENGVIKIA